jgi:hypothetical protein
MEEDAVPVILLVVGFEENAADPMDVSAMVLQADADGEAFPAEQSISQEDLDEMISSGRMPVRELSNLALVRMCSRRPAHVSIGGMHGQPGAWPAMESVRRSPRH